MSISPPTVYLVDDDASFLPATARLLRAAGFAVKTFSSTADFLAQCDRDSCGCVVTDLQMPGMNGMDLMAALARKPDPLPVLFLTGAGDIPASVHAMQKGADDFLEKRAPKEKLFDAIRRALERDAREREARHKRAEMRELFDALSTREREVLSHVFQGKLNKQIADELGIHERTVKLHRTAITTKLGAPSVPEILLMAQETNVYSDGTSICPKGQ